MLGRLLVAAARFVHPDVFGNYEFWWMECRMVIESFRLVSQPSSSSYILSTLYN
jgi:hypothetical protein